MLNKSKRFILGLFMIFLFNDLCQYMRILLFNMNVIRFEIFYTVLDGKTIFNTALIFICIISVYKFIKGFFSEE